MSHFKKLFKLYHKSGNLFALWVTLRVLILPFYKINHLISSKALVVDIGCGNGGLANYLSIACPKRKIFGIDYSTKRILQAKRTINNRKNIKFINANVLDAHVPKADYYLISDVLHHISYANQIKLLKKIVNKMNANSTLIIKEVDVSNTLPFLFGHLWEKLFYPWEKISVRSKIGWKRVLGQLKLNFNIETGAFYFPDSTLIFVCNK